MEFDRYLRFRHLEKQTDGAFIVRREGIIVTNFGEDHETTFSNAFHPLEGDLLEVEYPASYGYFIFGQADGKWSYTQKTA